ncbi:MAG TPA: ABC transporter ATP-binding protein [Planctomycetaceae bacterium]|nr:ABC transporter ATP-binding protein [Planctomycetaceae bacterium]
MIEVTDLKFEYGDGGRKENSDSPFSLQVPRLSVTAGTSAAVVGPSGSGKTTLLHLLSGILIPGSGSIAIGEFHPAGESDSARRRHRLRNIGMVFQNFELIEYLSVLDNVLLPCRIDTSIPLTPELRDRARELLSHCGLEHLVRRNITQLSQGEQQRVAICRALLTSPALILADEPTGNLDPTTSQQIMNLLLNSVRDQGATLVMVTHDHSLLNQFDQTIDFLQFLSSPNARQESQQ